MNYIERISFNLFMIDNNVDVLIFFYFIDEICLNQDINMNKYISNI